MPRQIPGDWCAVGIPDNARLHETTYVETSLSFEPYRSRRDVGLTAAEGAGIYYGCTFDVGPAGRVSLGRCCLLTSAMICCDDRVDIGDHCLVSWSVVIMDSYRVPTDPRRRRAVLDNASGIRLPDDPAAARPVRIGHGVWIGFESVVLPGVTIGDGSIVGCRSVVAGDVPPYTLVAGNPARIVRQLERPRE